MSRFSNPRTAQAMMETHGHTNIGMPPKPGFPGAAAPTRPGVKPTVTGAPDKNLPFIINNKPAQMPMAGTRPGVTTGGPKPGVAIGPQNINPARPPTPATAPASINGLGSRFARAAKPMKKGGKVSSASKRADGIAVKGKTRGRIV